VRNRTADDLAVAPDTSHSEELARYREGFARMTMADRPYSRELDISGSAAVLQFDNTAGPQSGFHAYDRARAFSNASNVLAYAMPQELTDQGVARAQAEAIIARAQTQVMHETAYRDAAREAKRPKVFATQTKDEQADISETIGDREERNFMQPQKAQDAPPTIKNTTSVRADFAPASQGAVRPSRANKVLLGAWIDPEYKRHLLMLKVKDPDRTTESLVQEALDDLFAKHSVPPVPAPRKKAKDFTHGD
jgi:hypothetical protein